MTVYYTVGNTIAVEPLTAVTDSTATADEAATAGTDYVALSGSVTIPAGEASADVLVSAMHDNEFEDPETIELTLIAPQVLATPYLLGLETSQILTIADNPPQSAASVVWQQVGTEIGQVTLTRSGGDISQPLTSWFEVEGTLEDGGEILTVVMAASAVFPAGVTSLTIPIIADPNNGGIENVQMPGAVLVPLRDDKSELLYTYLGYLNGEGPTSIQLGAMVLARRILPEFPTPISYAENVALSLIRNKVQSMPDSAFVAASDKTKILDRIAELRSLGVEWKTLPEPLAMQAVGGVGGVITGLITSVPDWPSLMQQVDALVAQLGAAEWSDREEAEQALKNLIGGYLLQGDFTRATLIVDRIAEIIERQRTRISRTEPGTY